ncbi:uncharacterized protein [Ptychodera flava]|uniref:uncharacterized protein n=1 Tax=Ptychodera flava TaxID=63121 RepID=UPI00396A509F
MLRYILLAISLSSFAAANFYQVTIPKEPFGYVYKSGSSDAPVVLSVWQCLQCSDAAAAWPVLKEVGDHYGPAQVQVVFYGFPLPYLRGAFLSARATKAVDQLDPSLTVDYMDLVYANQDKIGRSPDTVSDADMLEVLVGLAEDIGILREDFLDEYNKAITNVYSRNEWKVGITDSVHHSPTIFVNNVVELSFNPSWTLQDWTAVIDPLLA